MEENITKTGPQDYRSLQEQNESNTEDFNISNYIEESKRMINSGLRTPEYVSRANYAPAYRNIGEELSESGYGESMFDDAITNTAQLKSINDIRAEEQPWLAKLGAGIGKGVSLAGTTWLDGTLGLVTGVGTMLSRYTNMSRKDDGTKYSGWESFAGLWDNEISNGLQEWNNYMEKVMPNYYSDYEKERPFYENFGTVNFWADGFLKNLGFTVGAMYSGGAWNKVLKGVGAIKTSMGAKVTGSMLSAVNEGRIEANNNSDDWEKVELAKLEQAKAKAIQDVLSSGDSGEDKLNRLKTLDILFSNEESSIKDKKAKMGASILLANSVLLSLDDYYTFGKLYARGFKNAEKRAAETVSKESISDVLNRGAKEIAEEDAKKRVIEEGGKYIFNEIKKGKAIRRGLGRGLVEGNEEMAQQFITNVSGEMQEYDSPDSYYNAITDPKANLQTKNFLTAVTNGFTNSYGNMDQYEQFAVGFLTGIFGTPTFGSLQNSDSNTYLGRGKMVGMSGGLFGELSSANEENREGQEAVDFMNNYREKIKNHKRYFAESTFFTNAMDRFAEEKNKFEYKNAEDNDDFSAVARFASMGRLQDLKDLINEDFENISDEELSKIAAFTTTASDEFNSGWRNTDGSLMSESEEGRAQMRKDLARKRDKILKEIDAYESSVEDVRAIGNNSLTDDQVEELAWLQWKVKRFEDRYNGIKEDLSSYTESILSGLNSWEKALTDERFNLTEDKDSEVFKQNSEELKKIRTFKSLVSQISEERNILGIAGFFKAHPEIFDLLTDKSFFSLYSEKSNLNYNDYVKVITNLLDTSRIANAAITFNERLKEFMQDPTKLLENREKIDRKNQTKESVQNNLEQEKKIEDSSIPELVKQKEEGELDDYDVSEDEFGDMDEDDSIDFDDAPVRGENITPIATSLTNKQKVREASKISSAKTKLLKPGGLIDTVSYTLPDSDRIAKDAKKLVLKSADVANSEDEFLDLSTISYNDSKVLYEEGDERLGSPEELQEMYEERLTNAKTLLSEAVALLKEESDGIKGMPKGKIAPEESSSDLEETGHDATVKGKPVNDEESKEGIREETINTIVNGLSANSSLSEKQIKEATNILVSNFEKLASGGIAYNECINSIMGESTPNSVKLLFSEDKTNVIPTALAKYYSTIAGIASPESAKIEKEKYDPAPNEIVSSTPTESELTTQINAQFKNGIDSDSVGYKYWIPVTTELPRFQIKGDFSAYYEVLEKELIAQFGSYDKIPEERKKFLQRTKAIYNYLKDNNAFDTVDSGRVQKGSKVVFKVVRQLNEDANGDATKPVILIALASDGTIIGDLQDPEKMDPIKQADLIAFANKLKEEYAKQEFPEEFIFGSTTVSKMMIGKIPYTKESERKTLNSIFGENKFSLAISVSNGSRGRLLMDPGRRKSQGVSKRELSIAPPINAKSGQPYVIITTGDAARKYMPVPFTMERYNSVTADSTRLGKAVNDVLSKFATISSKNLLQIKEELQELLALPELHINISENNPNNITVSIKEIGSSKQRFIYSGNRENAANNIKLALTSGQGIVFQVSRKYINDTYKGQDYNSMIGEIAKTNLNNTHTLSDWFTLNPIDPKGKIVKADNPKSIKTNPNAVVKPATETSIKKSANDAAIQKLKSKYTIATPVEEIKGNERGRKQIEKGLEDLRGAKTPEEKLNAIAKIELNVYRGAVISKEEAEELKSIRDDLYTQGYEAPRLTYTPYVEGSNITPTFVEDDSLPAGSAVIIGVQKPQINKNGVMVQSAEVTVAQGPQVDAVTTEDGDSVSFDNDDVVDRSHPIRVFHSDILSKPQEAPTRTTSEEAYSKVKLALGNDPIKNAVWNALNLSQQIALAKKPGPVKGQLINKLILSYSSKLDSFLPGTKIDELLGVTYNRLVAGSNDSWNKEKELKWIKKVLPELSTDEHLRLVDGLIKISKEDGSGFAWGQFKNGIITIADTKVTASGTVYHEAFHAVMHTLLSTEEQNKVFEEAKNKYGDLDIIALEENVAEDFRQYVQLEDTPILGGLVKIYRKLKHVIQNLFGKENYLNKLFYDINRGNLKNAKFRNAEKDNTKRYRLEEYTEEQKEILRRASRNSDGQLLAPNGKVSNLNERQYVHVRTKVFKDWFGDWENDPKNASKVIDENGEPRIVYHGSPEVFDTFNIDMFGRTDQGDKGRGFYFGVGKPTAEGYGDTMYEAFLNIRNPYVVKDDRRDSKVVYFNRINILSDGERLKNKIQSLEYSLEVDEDKLLDMPSDLGKTILEKRIKTNTVLLNNLKNDYNNMTEQDKNSKPDTLDEYDGVMEEIPHYEMVVKSPNQIKSAVENVGTYSKESDNIYYRKIQNYYESKMAYSNLSEDFKSYIKDKGISKDEYLTMSTFEREVLFKCR